MTELLQSSGQSIEVDDHALALGSELGMQVAEESRIRDGLTNGVDALLGLHTESSPTDGDLQSLGADVSHAESVDSADRARPA